MPAVTVLVLAPELAPDAGPLERALDAARTALAEHHRVGFLAAGASRRGRPTRAAGRDAVRGASPPAGRGAPSRRPGRARGGLHPAGDGRRPGGVRAGRRGRGAWRAREPSRVLADVLAIACAARSPCGTCRTSRPTTRCPAGSRRSPACRFATCARGAGWRWTSTRRWTCCCSRASAARPGLPGPGDADGGPVRDRLGAHPGTGRRPGHGAARRRPHVRGRPPMARDAHAVADAGAGRGARPADRRRRGDARAPEPPPAPQRARRAARARRAGVARPPGREPRRRRPHRQPRAPRASPGRRRAGMAAPGGPVRERPAPRRSGPRPVAPGPDRGGRGRRRPDPARRPQPGRARGAAARSRTRR